MSDYVIQAQELYKSFKDAGRELTVLRGIDLDVKPGETVAIAGASGSGKSTLLHCLGGLDTFTAGHILWGESDIRKLSERKRSSLRNQHLSFVYQFHHLLNEFTAIENVAIPLLIGGVDVHEAKSKAAAMLNEVGLSERESHKPGELSGGERQRVALARALVTQPKCLLADEPTGNLDRKTATHILELLLKLNKAHNISLVIVTHDPSIAMKMDRQLLLEDGQLKY